MPKIIKILIVFFALGCGKTPPSGKPLVLVSMAPYKFFVEKIGGDAVEVRPIVPLSADPHVFEPTARQVREFAKATLWFQTDEPFEEKISQVLKGKVRIHDLHPSERHLWVSPRSILPQVEAMQQVLSEQFPEKAEEFKKNLAELVEELEALDREIQLALEQIQHRVLFVSHPAFGPFCRDYDIEQLSIEEEGKEVRLQHLEEVVQRAAEAQFALALPQHNNKGLERVAVRLDLPVLSIDPYSENYFEMMRTLTQYLVGSP